VDYSKSLTKVKRRIIVQIFKPHLTKPVYVTDAIMEIMPRSGDAEDEMLRASHERGCFREARRDSIFSNRRGKSKGLVS